ncbi:diphosphomevalonate decarboxylase [bacterium]|nr:diphosphomevalonate decarboxylase [bacterium]
MNSFVRAKAHSNIALIKYWGKLAEETNSPATPSISLTLDALTTTTDIKNVDEQDSFEINGNPVDDVSRKNLKDYLEIWRRKGYLQSNYSISSQNNFPTKAGLASSASGYAALATGLNHFAPSPRSKLELSSLARMGSGSAARSIFGGIVALPPGSEPEGQILVPKDEVPWGMVIALVEESAKRHGSRSGMIHTNSSSPYHQSWVKQGNEDYSQMLRNIQRLDLEAVGELMEANTLAMHANMIAARPPLLYWNSISFTLINLALEWRASGLQTYVTLDAGPNVIFLADKSDLSSIAKKAEAIPGVIRTITCLPGGDAEVISSE